MIVAFHDKAAKSVFMRLVIMEVIDSIIDESSTHIELCRDFDMSKWDSKLLATIYSSDFMVSIYNKVS